MSHPALGATTLMTYLAASFGIWWCLRAFVGACKRRPESLAFLAAAVGVVGMIR